MVMLLCLDCVACARPSNETNRILCLFLNTHTYTYTHVPKKCNSVGDALSEVEVDEFDAGNSVPFELWRGVHWRDLRRLGVLLTPQNASSAGADATLCVAALDVRTDDQPHQPVAAAVWGASVRERRRFSALASVDAGLCGGAAPTRTLLLAFDDRGAPPDAARAKQVAAWAGPAALLPAVVHWNAGARLLFATDGRSRALAAPLALNTSALVDAAAFRQHKAFAVAAVFRHRLRDGGRLLVHVRQLSSLCPFARAWLVLYFSFCLLPYLSISLLASVNNYNNDRNCHLILNLILFAVLNVQQRMKSVTLLTRIC